MAKADFICIQPIEGVPVVKYIYSDAHCVYSALSVPVAVPGCRGVTRRTALRI